MLFICGKSQHKTPKNDRTIETTLVATAQRSTLRFKAEKGSSSMSLCQYDMASRTEIKYMIEHKKSMHQYLNRIMVVLMGCGRCGYISFILLLTKTKKSCSRGLVTFKKLLLVLESRFESVLFYHYYILMGNMYNMVLCAYTVGPPYATIFNWLARVASRGTTAIHLSKNTMNYRKIFFDHEHNNFNRFLLSSTIFLPSFFPL
jgi:hypothetical protein